MPCKCLTGCINKKCSCRAKGIDCTEECAYCKNEDDKYECFNLPGKEPPIKSNSNSRKSSRNNSLILINNNNENENKNINGNKNGNENKMEMETEMDMEMENGNENENENKNENENENEKTLVKTSKIVTKKIDKKPNETNQTIIINNYYCNNEYKQSNVYTQVVNQNYEITGNNNNGNSYHKVDNLIKNLYTNDGNNFNTLSQNKNNMQNLSSIPKLTETLAVDFLKFYWECLSNKNKTKYIEKYICNSAELKIQGVPFVGAQVIAKRLEEAAPIKINKIEHKIFPVALPEKKFSVTSINNKLLGLPSPSSPSSSSSSSKNLISYHQNLSSNSNILENNKSKDLVLTDPNLPNIGKIEINGIMMDRNGYSVQFIQNYHLVYNKITKDVQIKSSELKWL